MDRSTLEDSRPTPPPVSLPSTSQKFLMEPRKEASPGPKGAVVEVQNHCPKIVDRTSWDVKVKVDDKHVKRRPVRTSKKSPGDEEYVPTPAEDSEDEGYDYVPRSPTDSEAEKYERNYYVPRSPNGSEDEEYRKHNYFPRSPTASEEEEFKKGHVPRSPGKEDLPGTPAAKADKDKLLQVYDDSHSSPDDVYLFRDPPAQSTPKPFRQTQGKGLSARQADLGADSGFLDSSSACFSATDMERDDVMIIKELEHPAGISSLHSQKAVKRPAAGGVVGRAPPAKTVAKPVRKAARKKRRTLSAKAGLIFNAKRILGKLKVAKYSKKVIRNEW
jgi:hypothetical protein